MKEAIGKEGFIGIFMGGFTASALEFLRHLFLVTSLRSFRPENEEIVKRMSKKCKILLFSSVDNVMVKIVSLLRGFEGGNL